MAGEQLKTASELLADFPDNTAGLIDALQSRNFVVSSGEDVAFVQEVNVIPVGISPTTVLADTVVNTAWVAPDSAFRFWALDGAEKLINDYGSVIINAGTFRLVTYQFNMLLQRQPPITPLQFGGNYQIIHDDGIPGVGDVALHSNLTQMRVSYTDDDANDLTSEWQSMGNRDFVNLGGILYKIDAAPIQNVGDLQITFAPLQRQAASGGADQVFTQGLARDDDLYEFGIFANGVQLGPSFLRSIGDTGDYVSVEISDIRDVILNEPIDLRIAKTLITDPDVDIFLLEAIVQGNLI